MKKYLLSMSLMVICGAASFGQIPTTGLVAHYDFSGNANDQSGNGNDGTVQGATLTTDRFNNANSAYEFDGTSSFIEVPNSASLQSPSDSLSLSAWIYITDTTVLNWILDKRINTGSSPYSSYGFYTVLASNSVNGGLSAGQIANAGFAPIKIDTWMHLGLTYNGSQIKFYLDGMPYDSANVTGNIQYSTMPLFIGKSPNNAAFTAGKIDDIRIYNTTLSDENMHDLSMEGTSTGVIDPTSIKGLRVYPNPSNGNFTVDFSSTEPANYNLEIMNVKGQVLMTEKLSERMNVITSTADLPKGVYFLRVTSSDEARSVVRKIVIQ